MATFNPNQSLLPSVGGSITPMSGGGASLQEGGEVKAGGSRVLLDAELAKYTGNESIMRTALKKMAPEYFKNDNIQKDITDLFEMTTDFNANELKIKKEVLNYIPNISSKKIKRVFAPEKKGSIENTPESQLKLLTYI